MNKEQQTREKILDAVFKIVNISGNKDTMMGMILNKYGITKVCLYIFFKSKIDVVVVVDM